MRFDASAAYVVTWDLWKGYVVSLATKTWTRISKIADLDGIFLDIESNTMYIPDSDIPLLYRINFDPVVIDRVELGHSSPLFTIRKSPVNSTFILLYEDGRVECREGLFGSPIWSRQFVGKEITASGSFSGDGRFYGLNVVNLEQYWVLDASTGAVIHKKAQVKQGVHPRSPLQGSLILNSSGTILDAETGEVQPGVSSLDWWTQAGMPLPPAL
ncbi:MAG: PQQ-like beta-propeller repeat protein [Phycisphaerales bacterium]|nr:PQQ-like beta-propeller repeat protein [Phycisphaerales bacterium]